MKATIKINKPTMYKRTEDVLNQETGKVEKQTFEMITWQTEGTDENLELFYQDSCATAGKQVSKNEETGTPLFRLNFISTNAETGAQSFGFLYGETNELERTVINGKATWIPVNNAEIKDLISIVNNANIPAFLKGDAEAQIKYKMMHFRGIAAKNTAEKNKAYYAKQEGVTTKASINNAFTDIP